MNSRLTSPSDPRVLLDKVLALRSEAVAEARTAMLRWLPNISRHSFRASALNLATYLALQKRDVRSLQQELIPWGLSALGCSATGVLANLDSVIAALAGICGQIGAGIHQRGVCRYAYGERRLERNAVAVLGPRLVGHTTRIMVTVPPQAGVDYAFVKNLVESGMSVARINCAHGSREGWDAMIDNIHLAEQETGNLCKVLMDLCGTKPRIAAQLLTSGDGRLNVGDSFVLAKEFLQQADIPVAITCTLPDIIDSLSVGDPVLIDDGKVEATVTCLVPGGAVIRIIRTSPKGSRLKLQKGLNFPQTIHTLSPLTSKDITDLDYILCKADMIGYSFVKDAGDIALLQQEIEKRLGSHARDFPLIAKIETSQALNNLPDIIAQGASRQPFGLMIARGDLAVELGYKHLAELQEKILWSAKAAHIPTIWATQVLESLVENGAPSRAEMTDVAMAARAECVMLNKGPFLPDAVAFLDDILSQR